MEIRTRSRVHVATLIHWREVLVGRDLGFRASRHPKEKARSGPFLKGIIFNLGTA